ncbi:MAG TPA: outer membrane lipoprotein carrier protein LolA, partial [Streptosporangiaceae bacterium]
MNQLANLSRRARWAVPTGAVVVIGGVLAGSMVSVAQASPSLPARTPAQLLSSLASRPDTPPLTGTVDETSSLGLPSLPGTSDPTSIASLLSGSHTVRIWYADPRHFRVSVPQSMSESDIIRDGGNAWVWQSSTNTVTRMAIPARSGQQARSRVQAPEPPLSPQQAANEILAKVGPTTTVRVDSNVTVAGEAAYQLVLAPKSSGSLIGQIRIAVDGRRDVPLRVQVFAKGARTPAMQIGFTSVSFVRPAASNFAFTAPAGATVKNEQPGDKSSSRQHTAKAGDGSMIGQGWLAVADLPGSALTDGSHAGGQASSGSGLSGDSGQTVNALIRSATRVSG